LPWPEDLPRDLPTALSVTPVRRRRRLLTSRNDSAGNAAKIAAQTVADRAVETGAKRSAGTAIESVSTYVYSVEPFRTCE